MKLTVQLIFRDPENLFIDIMRGMPKRFSDARLLYVKLYLLIT